MTQDLRFPVFDRGDLREEMLDEFRNGLRLLINPETGLPFSEHEIATATADFTRWWAEANAIDLLLLAVQSRALFLSDQILPDRASGAWLARHGALRVGAKLPASGGGGNATGECLVGSTFVGSTTLPDPVAHYAVDAAGRRYQVVETKTATSDLITLRFKCVDTGRGTNIVADTRLTWVLAPPGAQDFFVNAQFRGGSPAETDRDYAARIMDAMRHKQGAGNRDQLRALARKADASITDAVFVYASAYHAGSFHVSVCVGREGVVGPDARIAPAATVLLAKSVLTPPGSSEIPGEVTGVVTADRAYPVNVALTADLLRGGFADAAPWPVRVGFSCPIAVVNSQTDIEVLSDDGPEGLPSVSAWNASTSRWEELDVLAVVFDSPNWRITLNTAPTFTLTTSTVLSPTNTVATEFAEALELYFDSLGPGELVEDERLGRAYRYPPPSDRWPSAISLTELAGWVKQTIGQIVGQGGFTLISASATEPPVPEDPTQGPYRLTIGQIGVYPP